MVDRERVVIGPKSKGSMQNAFILQTDHFLQKPCSCNYCIFLACCVCQIWTPVWPPLRYPKKSKLNVLNIIFFSTIDNFKDDWANNMVNKWLNVEYGDYFPKTHLCFSINSPLKGTGGTIELMTLLGFLVYKQVLH